VVAGGQKKKVADICSCRLSATVNQVWTLQQTAKISAEVNESFDYGRVPSTDAAMNAVDKECI